MMYWIVNWSVKFRVIVLAIAAGLVLFGFLQVGNVKKDLLPEFSPTTVEVQTEALGLSASEVEQLITVPLEQDLLNGVAFVDTMESVSLPGLSSVVMTFEDGTPLLDARQVVAERLTQAAGLPQVADPPQMIQPLSSTSRVAMVSLDSDELTPIETSVLARWVMVPRLLGVDGVANVSIWGFRDQQLQVLVDPANLATQNVSLSQVIATTGNALEVSPLSFLEASLPGTGGFIDTVNQRLHVFHEQAISTPEELAQVTVEGPEGGAVFVDGEALALGDVAEIVTDHQPLIGDARCSDGPCTLLVIEKFPEANTPAVASGIDEALDALSLGLPGMEIDTSIYRPAALIEASVDNLRTALLVGAVLLLLVLVVFLFNWRVLLISVVSIVSSLAVAGVTLVLFDITVNVMIVAGLVAALVVIIDDAVVGAWGTGEAAVGDEEQPVRVIPSIVDSILRFRSAAVYTAVIVAVTLLPVLALSGTAGAFLEPIALAFLLAIAAGILVSLTVAPALSALLLGEGKGGWKGSFLTARLGSWYRGLATRFVPRTTIALIVFGVFIVGGAVAAVFLTPSLQPDLKERDILVQLEAPPGTSLPRMDEITAGIVADLRSESGVMNVGAHVGRAIMSDQIVNVNSAEIWINIDPSADYAATIATIDTTVAGNDQVASRVLTYSDQRVTEVLHRSDDELVVRVYGENSDIRRDMAEQIQSVMASVDGVEDPRIDVPPVEPTVEISVDLEAAQAFGVKPGEVRRQAATLVSGIVVGNLFEDQKVFDVVVWGVPGIRDTVGAVAALPIATPSGDHVPLGEVADVQVVPKPAAIRHESSATYTDVSAPVSGRSLGSAAKDVEAAVDELQFPLEHHAELLGGFAEARAAQWRVVAAAVAALILIYLLLQAAFASWRLATTSFLLLPMAVSGSLIAIALTGGDLKLGSIAGAAAVFALATRVVISGVKSYQRRERLGEDFGAELVVGVNTHLVAPALISALAIAATFLPLVFTGSQAGLEIVGPMAVAVLGGLVTTVLMAAIVLPGVYLRWGYVAERDRSADDLFTSPSPAGAGLAG